MNYGTFTRKYFTFLSCTIMPNHHEFSCHFLMTKPLHWHGVKANPTCPRPKSVKSIFFTCHRIFFTPKTRFQEICDLYDLCNSINIAPKAGLISRSLVLVRIINTSVNLANSYFGSLGLWFFIAFGYCS